MIALVDVSKVCKGIKIVCKFHLAGHTAMKQRTYSYIADDNLLLSSRHHLSHDDYVEDKRENY